MAAQTEKIWQPIDPQFERKLDDEYVKFHKAKLLYRPRADQIPWSPTIRDTPAVIGTSEPLPVGSVVDYDLRKCRVRVFTPEGEPPTENGWPAFIFFHGGGWTLGNISTENTFSSNACKRANCVVVSVDYRLAPENPYPAAVEDAVESLEWVLKNAKTIRADAKKIAVGGSSSGGNLAAVLAHKAATMTPPVPLIFQLLIVPVIDNTASSTENVYPSWSDNIKTCALVPDRMLWFRNLYLPNEADRAKWDNSPMFAPDETFQKVPNAWIGVCERDILRDEGVLYGKKLRQFGKRAELVVYPNAPHPILAKDGVLKVGRQLVTDAVNALSRAFA